MQGAWEQTLKEPLQKSQPSFLQGHPQLLTAIWHLRSSSGQTHWSLNPLSPLSPPL